VKAMLPLNLTPFLVLVLTCLSLTQLPPVIASLADVECTLYLAPTTTTDQTETGAKLSMFTGVNMEAGETIGIPEIAIPFVDVHLHNDADAGEIDPDYFEEQENFMWSADTAHANFDIFPDNSFCPDSGSSLLLAIPGVGGLGNEHFTSYINADFDSEAVLKRRSMMEKDSEISSSGRGANSNYYDVTLRTTRFIPVGMEILVGDVGAPENDDSPLIGADFEDVDAILTKIQTFFDKHGKSMDEEKRFEIYEYLVGSQFTKTIFEDDREDKDEIMEIIGEIFPDLADLNKVIQNGGSFLHHFPESQKSLEWLKENGQCLDGLYTGKSTIPGAEKGAFATRTIEDGDLISPAPLLMISDSKYMDMYPLHFENHGKEQCPERKENNGEPITQQLLVNYCFGHPKSSLLFYPYGMGMNMINHKPTGKGANAKLVWTNASYHDPSLLSEEDIENVYEATLPLGMDIIATRKIAADEEIFLDYGVEWQQAWDKHVRNHKSNEPFRKDALQWNEDARVANDHFLTVAERDAMTSEGKKDPIPDHILTACHVTNPTGEDGEEHFFNEEETQMIGEHWTICDVLERISGTDNDGTVYTVKANVEGETVVVKNIPQKYIRFADKPYTNPSIHSENAFRHPIGIPDDIFPSVWRNLD
jgi:hypothetical protein